VKKTVSLYAFQAGTPDVPVASATGVFVEGLVDLLQAPGLPFDVRIQRLKPADASSTSGPRAWRAATRWLAGEYSRLLRDSSNVLVFIYPKLPVLAHVAAPRMLSLAQQLYRLLTARARLTGQRIVVIVEDLPVELAEGRAAAGGPPVDLDGKRFHAIERRLFRFAHRLVVPAGFEAPLRQRYGISADRFRTFRRNVYVPADDPETPPIEVERGVVNFFYSGAVDSHVAANFREVLRSIRNAPQARLHVCGPGRDAVQEWLHELAVPNVTHHGQLGRAVHDWLARQCDIGLILYPTDNPYNHLTPTMKYSAYLANGLAVLSTDLRCVSDNIRQDGVGQAMPIRELALEIMRWATRRQLWAAARARAREQASAVSSGSEMRSWLEELAVES
jgi:hypothetical protein